jgi:membrane protein
LLGGVRPTFIVVTAWAEGAGIWVALATLVGISEREISEQRAEAHGGHLEPGRGRHAQHPGQIPAAGWRDILLRVYHKIGEDNASLVAAGIALNSLLAIFPALAVAVLIYGLFSSPASVAQDLKPFFAILPPDAAKLLQDQLQSLVAPAHVKLGLGAIISALVAFWSARQGISAIMTATNIAYYEHERRGFFTQAAISLGFTLSAVLAFLVMLVLGVAVPLIVQVLPMGPAAAAAILMIRWVLLWLFAIGALTVVYRYAPDRRQAKWGWVTWGSAAAATLWLLGSALFELYVNHFSSYGATYGASDSRRYDRGTTEADGQAWSLRSGYAGQEARVTLRVLHRGQSMAAESLAN